jgi:hypothetical protein
VNQQPTVAFQKPWLPYTDQVKLLQDRGLVVTDFPHAAQWKTRVTDHLVTPPATSDPHKRMGLTANWNQHPVWT